MNHQLKYGYSQLGTNILVKINCKMSNQQAVELEKKFPEICIWQTRNGYRIEGAFNTKQNNVYVYEINKLIDKNQALLKQGNLKLNVVDLDII